MLSKEVTYTDFNGEEQKETLYFNLSKSELLKAQVSTDGGLDNYLTQIAESGESKQIIEAFEMILKMAYGVRSQDGKRFIKTEEVWEEFQGSPAYDSFFFSLVTDAKFSVDFVNALLPQRLMNEIKQQVDEGASQAAQPQDHQAKVSPIVSKEHPSMHDPEQNRPAGARYLEEQKRSDNDNGFKTI